MRHLCLPLIALTGCAAPSPRATAPAVAASPAAPDATPRSRAEGTFDADGKAHGEWRFDCAGYGVRGCHAEIEHGVQRTWETSDERGRWQIERTATGVVARMWGPDGPLAWETGLVAAPAPWAIDAVASFRDELTQLPIYGDGACAGTFQVHGAGGGVVASGTCVDGRWATWDSVDERGMRSSTSRAAGEALTETFDETGQLRWRQRVAGTIAVLDEAWYADGVAERRILRSTAGARLEERRWYADGAPTIEDVNDGAQRLAREWSASGRLVSRRTWQDGKPFGRWQSWYDDGKRRSTVRFADDRDLRRCERKERRADAAAARAAIRALEQGKRSPALARFASCFGTTVSAESADGAVVDPTTCDHRTPAERCKHLRATPMALSIWSPGGRRIGNLRHEDGFWEGRVDQPPGWLTEPATTVVRTEGLFVYSMTATCALADDWCREQIARRGIEQLHTCAWTRGGSDPLTLWQGRIALEVHADAAGRTWIALPEPGGLTLAQRECFLADAPGSAATHVVRIDADIALDRGHRKEPKPERKPPEPVPDFWP